MTGRLFEALYRRLGARSFDVFVGFLVVLMLAASAVNETVGSMYLDVTREGLVRHLVAFELSMIVGAAIWVPFLYARLRPLRDWVTGPKTSADAEAAWRNIAVTLPRTVAAVIGIVLAAGLPVILLSPSLLADLEWWWALVLLAPYLLISACAAVIFFLLAEAVLEPVARELALTRRTTDAAPARGVSLSAKVLLLPPAVSFYVVWIAGAVGRESLNAAGRVAMGLGAAAVLSLTLTLGGTLLLRRQLVGPVDALVAAAERVGRGDLEVTIPQLAEDELGTLTRSFNEMVERLKTQQAALRESRARIVATADAERRRMERDLHDGAQQRLVIISLTAEMLARHVGDDPEAAALLERLRTDAARAVDELRDLAHGIYPPLLESDGLTGALEDIADHSAVPVTVETDGTGRYPSPVEAAVYFCCLEALQNATKHAGADTHVRIALDSHDGVLHFAVTDDGHGFDPANVNGSAGIQNMTDRIGALGGSVRIDSAPGRGTTVEGTVPL